LCHNVFYGTTQKVNINSNPSGADLYINGIATNRQTPCEVTIKRKVGTTEFNKKNQYNYVLKKNGYADYLISDNAKFNYVSLLNLYWVGIPYIIDIPTGAIWKYEKITLQIWPLLMQPLRILLSNFGQPKALLQKQTLLLQ